MPNSLALFQGYDHFRWQISDEFWVRPDSSLNVSTLYQLVPSPPIWKEREKTGAWKKKTFKQSAVNVFAV